MNNNNKNNIILYFLFGCIFSRLYMVYIAKIINIKYLPYYGIITLIISIMFLKNYLYNFPKTGFFGNKVWWNNNRLIHSLLYFIFSIMAFYKNKYSWTILLFDTLYGLISFIFKYFK